MIVPIWAASWELDCCHPEAEVGRPWSAPLCFAATEGPETPGGRRRELIAGLPDDERERGVVELDVVRLSPHETSGEVWGAGPLRFRASRALECGRLAGYLWLDAHSGDERSNEEVTCTGLVEAVHLVPIRYRRVGRAYEPDEQLPAIASSSTQQRSEVDRTHDQARGEPPIIADLLVTLRLDEQ